MGFEDGPDPLPLGFCEPAPPPSDDDLPMEMSESVQRAVEEAVPLIESLVTQIRGNARR